MTEDKVVGNCFDEFKDISPKRQEPTIQVLYEYEKHYLEMVRKYSQEIKFIADMLSEFRKEQEIFYSKTLPDIISKLKQDTSIDEAMQKVWLNRITNNIERSFALSETLINDYATKNIDEFKVAVSEKLRNV